MPLLCDSPLVKVNRKLKDRGLMRSCTRRNERHDWRKDSVQSLDVCFAAPALAGGRASGLVDWSLLEKAACQQCED